MATVFKQPCPLCAMEAEYCWVDYENRKYFECPACTFFQVSKRAEVVLAGLSQQRKASYAAQAPHPPSEHMLVILMPDHEHSIASDEPLQVGFVSKAKLPLRC